MINLLGTTQKAEIKAARLNVQLRKYAMLSVFVAIGVLAIYGVGFYLVMSDKDKAQQQLVQDEATTNQYLSVQRDAKAYKSNLTVASKVLDSGVSYSSFIMEIARSLPAGSILNDLTLTDIGGSSVATAATQNGGVILHTRTTSYGGALKVKESLEASAIFENVNITSIRKTESTAESAEAEDLRYPFALEVSVVITKQKAVQ